MLERGADPHRMSKVRWLGYGQIILYVVCVFFVVSVGCVSVCGGKDKIKKHAHSYTHIHKTSGRQDCPPLGGAPRGAARLPRAAAGGGQRTYSSVLVWYICVCLVAYTCVCVCVCKERDRLGPAPPSSWLRFHRPPIHHSLYLTHPQTIHTKLPPRYSRRSRTRGARPPWTWHACTGIWTALAS